MINRRGGIIEWFYITIERTLQIKRVHIIFIFSWRKTVKNVKFFAFVTIEPNANLSK